MKPFIIRCLKITGISIATVFALMFLLPILFPGFVSGKVKDWANSSIKGELNFSKARLSFFHHFPSLTLSLYDFSLKGAAPFQNDTLLSAQSLAFGLNLRSVFSSTININKIFIDKASIHVQVNEKGEANYNVYAAASNTTADNKTDSSGAALKMESIVISNSNLVYDDKSLPMLINARQLNYTGKGDFQKAVFDLASDIEASSVDFYYNKQGYFISKKLKAQLVTKINTNSLAFLFEKNDLKINSLPVNFKGKFEFLKNGYNMNFDMQTANTDLHDIFSALPAEYLGWLAQTDVKGFGDIRAVLSGQYIAEEHRMPNLSLDMKIRDGFVANQKAPDPIKNLFLNMQVRMPQCTPDSLYLNIDSIYFNINKDYLSAVLRVKGIKEPHIFAKMNTAIDLEKWDRALGLQPVDLKGRYTMHLLAEGKYATAVVPKGLRKRDTVITSIPSFNFRSSLENGYFKYAGLPQAVENISFNVNASCAGNNYKHTKLGIENINATILGSYLKGYFKLHNLADKDIEASLRAVCHLQDLAQVYPMDSLTLKGDLAMNLDAKGRYLPERRIFPVAKANLTLKNGFIQTKYYPQPIENIKVTADISNTAGNFKTLNIDLSPVSFRFAQQPFLCKADLRNFDNLRYDIVSRGILDLGNIYRVFAVQGYNLKGFIKTNLSLHGLQSDAAAGRFNKLSNSGTLQVKNIALESELFPQPLWVTSGKFHFEQDKMVFDAFQGKYGSGLLTLNGHLSNVIAYATQKNAPLRGNFNLKSDFLKVDEWMAFANAPAASTTTNGKPGAANTGTPKATAATGVLLIPANLDLKLAAGINKIQYQGLLLSDAQGAVSIDSGRITLDKTGFTVAGCKVNMDALYESLSPMKAHFEYHVNAENFDVKRMYKEVELFRNMVTAAAKAEGVISLDYKLSGKLDANMQPVYPSLKGNGVLTVQKVKMYGFKLFNAVGGATGKEGLKNPDLSKIEIKSHIANNIITIERTKMKVAGFRPRFEGQVSFDGKMNLSGRLGLPPLGIIGIPFSVTGTQENPKVKLRRGKESDKLEETTDPDDIKD
ncbi:AsmA family protein [Filimonas effusa]|uniref:AsmA family protein n=1 Tax=Filimonas effusa TaxID=2508721 RepID=A0A4Q1D4B1_9BACT|nr:AsmA family protein [Filimonas effusa]RXK81987.1 AsmA family protein [Filimonas effusa]